MATIVDDLYEKASALPPESRAALAGLIVDSLEGQSDPSIEKAWKAEISRRLQELDGGKVALVPWETVRKKLHKIIGAI